MKRIQENRYVYWLFFILKKNNKSNEQIIERDRKKKCLRKIKWKRENVLVVKFFLSVGDDDHNNNKLFIKHFFSMFQ